MKSFLLAISILPIFVFNLVNANDLIGQSYDSIKKDLPTYDSRSASCLLDCKYSIDSVSYNGEDNISIILSKKSRIQKWEIADILENVRVIGDKHYTQVANCTKHFASFQARYGFSTSIMPTDQDLIAIVHVTGKEKTDQELWVKATRAFIVDTDTIKFKEISTDDVFCYIGIG